MSAFIDATVIHFDVDLAIPASMAPDRFYVVYMPQGPATSNNVSRY